MQEIFYRDTNGRKVSVFVTDEVATAMRDVRREEWRSDAKAHYHNVSLQSLEEAGYQLADTSPDCLESLMLREESADKHRRLKQALSYTHAITETFGVLSLREKLFVEGDFQNLWGYLSSNTGTS